MEDFNTIEPLDTTISQRRVTQEDDPTVQLVVYDATASPTNESPTKAGKQPVIEHECFIVLSGRGKGTIGTKNDRINLIHDILQVDVSEYVPPHLTDDPLIKRWVNTYSALDKNPSKWKLPLLARAICDFDTILTNCRAEFAISQESRPHAIVTFEDYMDSAREISCVSIFEKTRVRKGQIGKQKDGEVMQEAYHLKDLEGCTYDFEACARCNHRFLLPVGMHISEILKIIEKVRKYQTAELKKMEWPFLKSPSTKTKASRSHIP